MGGAVAYLLPGCRAPVHFAEPHRELFRSVPCKVLNGRGKLGRFITPSASAAVAAPRTLLLCRTSRYPSGFRRSQKRVASCVPPACAVQVVANAVLRSTPPIAHCLDWQPACKPAVPKAAPLMPMVTCDP